MTSPPLVSFTPSSEAKTSIDSLIELLNTKGKMDLNSIAITLDVSPTILEEWAKVLENGKLIKISYEVGKMYLEPLAVGTGTELGKSAALKTEVQRSILQSEMEMEKITLDKFSKTLDELSMNTAAMEALYKQKLPSVQKLFVQLDSMSAPMAQKTKELETAQKSAESYFGQLDKKIDALYVKIDALENSTAGKALKEREAMLKNALSRADTAKAALLDLEDTRQALYGKISSDIDRQIKEFKTALKTSLDQIYKDLRADASEATIIDKQIRAELLSTAKIASEAVTLKKEAEAASANLATSRTTFKDSYQKITGELEKMSSGVAEKYVVAQQQLDDLKQSMGAVSQLHDSLISTRAELDSIQKAIQASRININTLIDSLKTLEFNKKMNEPQKEKALLDVTKKSMAAKTRGEAHKEVVE